MTDSSHAFFENRACRYYPCHEGIEAINCLFCFCPLYHLPDCPGSPTLLKTDSGVIRDCSACTFAHQAENYDVVMAYLAKG